MVQSSSLPYTSVFESARRGNLRSIALWLNQAFIPYGMRVRVGSKRPGLLKLLVEFDFSADPENPPHIWRDQLVRLICHRLWKLNSPAIDGVNIVARFLDQPKQLLWQRSVRIVTPASRNKTRTTKLRSQIQRTAQHKRRLRTTRTLLVGGPAVAAVMVGGILGYTRAPVEQKDANASSQPQEPPTNLPTRPDTVRAALEIIPVVKHNEVINPQDPTVTLMFSGDVTLAETFQEVMGDHYAETFAKMPEYAQADVAMVNLENPLTRATLAMPGKQFNFKADPASIEVLKSGGVDIVTLANNHTMDYDADGLTETIATLESAGIEYMGAGKDLTHARRPQIIDVKGQRIAYFAYWGEEYGAEANKPGVNNIQEARIAEDIQAIRDQVDWVVVNYHWGQELADFPADWQVKLAHFTVDQGADLVVGHHPHVLQGAEVYKGRPIAYSLGNFIFGGNARTDYDTAVLRVALKDKQMKVEFLPVEVRAYQPKVVEGDRGQDILKHLTQISAEFQQPMPSSVVLDARTPASPAPTAAPTVIPPTEAQTPTPLPTLDPGSSIDTTPIPAPEVSPSVTPDALQTEPPSAPKAQDLPTLDAAPSTAPDGTIAPTPSTSPAEQDVLPGYGGTPVPMPSPSPSIDPLNPDAYLDPAPQPVTPVTPPPPDAATESLQPEQPIAAPTPQLPNFSQPGHSFTTSPNQTPLNFEQAPPAPDTQGSVPANRSSISFQIQPSADPEADLEEPLQVALIAPMMW